MEKNKKRILFVIPEYSIGGTNTSLKNLISFIDKSKYEISIYCLYEDGTNYFKEAFRPYILSKSHLYYWLHDNIITRKFIGLGRKLSSKINYDWLFKYETKYIQDKYHFDVVIAYQEGAATNFVYHFEHVKKIAWFHSPYIDFVPNIREQYLDIYKSMDFIFCVSKTFVDLFVEKFPELKDKVRCMYNTLNNEQIRKMAEEPINDERFKKDCFTIVTIGRLAYGKGFDIIPSIVDKVNKIGINTHFKWYLICSGNSYKEQTEKAIDKYKVKNQVILLGPKDNPYPFLKSADLYICTSLFESFSYTIAESKILHTPLVTNDFPVAYEVVDDKVGWICNIDNMDTLIADIINDKDGCYSKVKCSISDYSYDNEEIIQKIYNLLECK